MSAPSDRLSRALSTLQQLAQLCAELSETEVRQVVEEMRRVVPANLADALRRDPPAAKVGAEPYLAKRNAMFGERVSPADQR
ncbi:MAG TPA: hypothetical protein VFK09_02285 [Gemmatimonadales bacterium]|jgi:hypothetical protein|nr:hypothetical protein [Gemmatimonadales bacterium]